MSDHIFIRCPVTLQPVKTGFRAPKDTDISALKQVALHHCPGCGNSHVWSAENGFWENEAPAVSSFWDDMRRMWRRPKLPPI